jgi:hypothetical protein
MCHWSSYEEKQLIPLCWDETVGIVYPNFLNLILFVYCTSKNFQENEEGMVLNGLNHALCDFLGETIYRITICAGMIETG